MINLVTILDRLKLYFESRPLIKEVTIGSVYENLNTENRKYPIINIDYNNVTLNTTNTYDFYLYFADRLTETKDNVSQIQSLGINEIKAFVKYINDNICKVEEVTINPFQQRFADECAGVWTSIEITFSDDIDYCFDGVEPVIKVITEAGIYDVSSYDAVEVNITVDSFIYETDGNIVLEGLNVDENNNVIIKHKDGEI